MFLCVFLNISLSIAIINNYFFFLPVPFVPATSGEGNVQGNTVGGTPYCLRGIIAFRRHRRGLYIGGNRGRLNGKCTRGEDKETTIKT